MSVEITSHTHARTHARTHAHTHRDTCIAEIEMLQNLKEL